MKFIHIMLFALAGLVIFTGSLRADAATPDGAGAACLRASMWILLRGAFAGEMPWGILAEYGVPQSMEPPWR